MSWLHFRCLLVGASPVVIDPAEDIGDVVVICVLSPVEVAALTRTVVVELRW